MIDQLNAIGSVTGTDSISRGQADSLGDSFMQHLSGLESKLQAAETGLANFASGEADSLHQVMLSISKAKTAFELTLQVRNRVMEAYQEVLRMGV